jgi:hypothetical protein
MQKGGDEVGTGNSERERKPGERPEAVQTLMRAGRRYVRIAQEGALREAERETQEEVGSCQEKGSQILRRLGFKNTTAMTAWISAGIPETKNPL